ncbi:hypothetical protein JNO42_06150 [Pseudomonas putida]|uniref:hypothetical protein n=1 Tax=Pseudomonas putida TaxID=303 RepID=UPI001EF9A850|nr:hypothetical protein [Pseudomonas putida]ULL06598.1 hypothetical protein JNO42_06150 [Pseudomonas putida]
MDTNKMREDFEAYWKRQLWAECYADVKEQMFTIWRASREAVVVELPAEWVTNVGKMLPPPGVRRAIEAQGLKVAP